MGGGLQNSVFWTGQPVDLFPRPSGKAPDPHSLNGGGREVGEQAQRDKETTGQNSVCPNPEKD